MKALFRSALQDAVQGAVVMLRPGDVMLAWEVEELLASLPPDPGMAQFIERTLRNRLPEEWLVPASDLRFTSWWAALGEQLAGLPLAYAWFLLHAFVVVRAEWVPGTLVGIRSTRTWGMGLPGPQAELPGPADKRGLPPTRRPHLEQASRGGRHVDKPAG